MNHNKLKHLEFIQAIVNRLGNNSFLVKSWCITLSAALTALSVGTHKEYIVLAYFPIAVFWLLDSYYLWQERLFRGLYDEVREMTEGDINFAMSFSQANRKDHSYFGAFFSITIFPFYAILIVSILFIIVTV